MVNFPGRDRRRRVLKDEVLSASNNYSSRSAASGDSANAPRYSDAAGVENHPQITDFIPRRYGTIAMLVLMGAGLTAMLAAMNYFAEPIVAATGVQSDASFSFRSVGSLATWAGAVVMLLASATSLMIYSIRRHRIDDFRGRYRVWFLASIACLMVSASSVVRLHQMLADVLGHFTGWTALRDGSIWWLAVAGLPLAWITLRALLDVRESRVATALLIGAVACYAISAVSFLGLSGVVDPRVRSISVGATLLMGHWLVLASAVSYARYVVLDAQGLIAVRRTVKAKRAAKEDVARTDLEPAKQTAKPAATIFSAAGLTRSTIQPAKTPADSSRWVDGTRPERDHRYDSDDDEDEDSSEGGGKLSKADRKRLRKLKAQGRAA